MRTWPRGNHRLRVAAAAAAVGSPGCILLRTGPAVAGSPGRTACPDSGSSRPAEGGSPAEGSLLAEDIRPAAAGRERSCSSPGRLHQGRRVPVEETRRCLGGCRRLGEVRRTSTL